jgi:hypothetical protein
MVVAGYPLLAESAAKACRVTGIVISTKAETRAQPAENQFRIRVLESPWDWQVGSSMPVTSAEPVSFGQGDTVEVDCDFAKVTRKGRFFGLARKLREVSAGAQVSD